MLYSVVVPVYNTEKYLAACIDSILCQINAPEYEIILVDNGSTDTSGAICERYAREYENIRVLHDSIKGLSRARNTGIKAAKGEYVVFSDSDDVFDPELLSVVEGLRRGAPDMILYNMWYTSEDLTERWPSAYLKQLPSGESGREYLERLFALSQVPVYGVWSTAFSRAFLCANDIFFDEELEVSEDFDYMMHCFSLAKRVVGTDRLLYLYRTRRQSLSRVFSAHRVLCYIKSRAYWYRRMPAGVLADMYVSQVLLVRRVSREEDSSALLAFIGENRDIIDRAPHPRYALARALFASLGYKRGAAVYCALRDSVQCLRSGIKNDKG